MANRSSPGVTTATISPTALFGSRFPVAGGTPRGAAMGVELSIPRAPTPFVTVAEFARIRFETAEYPNTRNLGDSFPMCLSPQR